MRERVHTIDAYWDGPKQGMADFDGKPHYYECEFDEEADEFSNVFRLTPIPDSIFKLGMEIWQIWCRWFRAFDAGEVTKDTHPALTEERPRYEELKIRYEEFKKIVDQHIANARPNSVRAPGNFLPTSGWGPAKDFEVEWVRLER